MFPSIKEHPPTRPQTVGLKSKVLVISDRYVLKSSNAVGSWQHAGNWNAKTESSTVATLASQLAHLFQLNFCGICHAKYSIAPRMSRSRHCCRDRRGIKRRLLDGKFQSSASIARHLLSASRHWSVCSTSSAVTRHVTGTVHVWWHGPGTGTGPRLAQQGHGTARGTGASTAYRHIVCCRRTCATLRGAVACSVPRACCG
jgi:hypothetical protein